MQDITNQKTRRDFLKMSGLISAPLLFPGAALASSNIPPQAITADVEFYTNFITDGLWFSPQQYLKKLQEIDQSEEIIGDYYGTGGPTTELENEFAKITGKEKAIYFPTGTMANQVAMKLLNGNKTKVIVPENSHIFRDEGDAAQSVHELRLIPLGKNKPYYDLDELKKTIAYDSDNFHYDSGLGTVVIENPVRRVRNRFIPFDKIQEIAVFCREKGYNLHLDGARLHIASAYSNVSVKEYAAQFDTVYISLYKYLNATGGAILCGDAELIDKMAHQIKILGGSILRNWSVTAMALHYLRGIDERWQKVISQANELIPQLNKIVGLEITPLENGCNSYRMMLDSGIDDKTLTEALFADSKILWSARIRDAESFYFVVNESMLAMSNEEIVSAWKKAIKKAMK